MGYLVIAILCPWLHLFRALDLFSNLEHHSRLDPRYTRMTASLMSCKASPPVAFKTITQRPRVQRTPVLAQASSKKETSSKVGNWTLASAALYTEKIGCSGANAHFMEDPAISACCVIVMDHHLDSLISIVPLIP